MNKIQVPGFIWSMLAALLAWALEYLTGHGTGIPWAPIAIAVIPALIKSVTVFLPPPAAQPSSIRGLVDAPVPASKWRKFLLGG